MAEFTGAHVELGISVKTGGSDLFYPIWSETIAPGGTTTQEAKGNPELRGIAQAGVLVFRVRANSAGPVFIAKGKTPDATKVVSSGANSARSHLLASELRDLPAIPGDKIHNVAAA